MADDDSTFELTAAEREMLTASRERKAAGSDEGGSADDTDLSPKGDEAKDPGSTFGESGDDEKPAEGEKGDDKSTPDKDASLELSEEDDPKSGDSDASSIGIDFEELSVEFNKTGTLSEDTLSDIVPKLEAAGLSADMVPVYLLGLTTLAGQKVAVAEEITGSSEGTAAMTAWANANLSKEERISFNTSLKGDAAAAKLAVAGVHALYAKATGRGAAHDYSGEGNSPDNSSVGKGVITTRSQFREIMKSDRYKKNESYRRTVDAALSKAQQSGTYNQQG